MDDLYKLLDERDRLYESGREHDQHRHWHNTLEQQAATEAYNAVCRAIYAHPVIQAASKVGITNYIRRENLDALLDAVRKHT